MNSQIPANNPVTRLYLILTKAIKTSEDRALPDCCPELFASELGRASNPYHLYGQFLDLIEQAIQTVKEVENINHDLFLEPLMKVHALFTSPNKNAWDSYKQNFDPVTMKSLAFCVDMLSRQPEETVLDKEKLLDLLSDVDELQEKLLETELDSHFQAILSEKLQEIRQAILQYHIYGIASLRRALESNCGAIVLYNRELKNEIEKQPGGAIQKYFDIVTKLNTLVSLAINSPKLIEPAIQHIAGFFGFGN